MSRAAATLAGIDAGASYSVFLLSPANLGGQRGAMVMNPRAEFALARELRSREGAALGDVFSFVSGLYFRGKAAYARAFGRLPGGGETGTVVRTGLVITPCEGLRFLDERVTLERLREWARVDIDCANAAFTEPLVAHGHELLRVLGDGARVVLLGSVATDKYVEPLTQVFRERLLFPSDFVGRGDMSRGALMLNAARDGVELAYQPVLGALRHGARAPGVSTKRRRAP